jgi:hypothetical protein
VNWRRISGKRRGRRQKTAACRKASNFDAISASETIADRPQSADLLFGSGCARILNFVLYQAQDPVGKTSAIGGGKLFRFLFFRSASTRMLMIFSLAMPQRLSM